MAYFAKKMNYCANETSFVALLVISRKKGGKPIKFVLYRYSSNGYDSSGCESEMIEFGPDKKDEAVKSFPSGPIVFEEQTEFFPRRIKNLWKKTTEWLYEVGAGGAYAVYSAGTYVKVGRPAPFNKRRKKFRLKFGELSHILIVLRKEIKSMEEEREYLVEEAGENMLSSEELIDIEKKIAEIEEEINIESKRANALIEEMKWKKKKYFNKLRAQK